MPPQLPPTLQPYRAGRVKHVVAEKSLHSPDLKPSVLLLASNFFVEDTEEENAHFEENPFVVDGF